MHKLSIMIFLSAFSLATLQGQGKQQEEFRYLFSSENLQFSGFGGPLVGFALAEGEFAVYNGGGGALLINQQFFIGGYGMGLSTAHRRDEVEIRGVRYRTLRTSFGHGGLWFGYIHRPAQLVHLAASLKAGWGQLALYEEKYHFDQYDFLAKDNVFVLTPQIEAEINLTHWFKLNAGLGYQLLSGVGDRRYSDTGSPAYKAEDYNGPTLTLGLLFGGFGKR